MADKILIVDDYPENLILLEETFLKTAISPIKANSGNKAIEIAIAEIPDLILLDVMMPGIDGFQVSSILKADERTKDIPIIFLTALTDTNFILKSFASGGVDYISKPFNEAELMARVFTHLEIRKQKKIIQKQLEEIKIREQEFSSIFELSNDSILITSKFGDIILANKKACELLEYSADDIKKLKVEAIMNQSYNINRDNVIQELYDKGNIVFETENISKSGKIIPVEISGSIINFGGQNVILSICRDLSERQKAEKDLKESEEKFRSFFENNSAMMMQVDSKTKKIINFNKSAKDFYGFSKDEFLNKTIYDINQLPKEEINFLMEKAISKESNFFRFIHKNSSNELKNVELSASPVKTKEGVFMFLIINDISELVIAEQKIIKLSTAVEQSANTIVITDINGNIEYVNPKFTDRTGYSYAEAVGQNPRVLKSGEQSQEFYKNLWDTILSGEIWKGEFHNKSKTGELFWEWATITPIVNDKDEIINFLAVKEDITERKKIENQLKIQYLELLVAKQNAEENEEKFRAIFENSADSITAVEKVNGETGKYIMVNRNAIDTYGYSKEEFFNMSPLDLISDKAKNDYAERIEYIDKNHTARFETDHITKSGKIIPVEINSKKINLKNKEIFLAIIRDISERKEIQQKILSTIIETEEKERERIAQDLHDGLGPLMSTIKLYVQWLTKPDLKADKIELAKKAEETIEIAYIHLRNIANNLSPHILKNFGLISAIKSFTDRIKELNFIDFQITTNLNQRIDNIVETIIYRILSESINNTLKHAKADKVNIDIRIENNELNVNYTDNGIGFDVDKIILKKSGLGLFNMINRIKSVNGQIQIESNEGMGTKIIINIKL
jgi:PAS domain S-box-containing protein